MVCPRTPRKGYDEEKRADHGLPLQPMLEKLKTLPHRPGIYQMLNAEGKIIYVGKARDLKKRVSSYFQKRSQSSKTGLLVAQIVDFKIILTASDHEALLLEANLIKEFKPKFNVLLRDDKSYPYLRLTLTHSFPRLDFYRGTPKKGEAIYYGPYPSPSSVRETQHLIQKLFKLRQCTDPYFNQRTRPCLQYQIKRCSAPCVNYITEKEYGEAVTHAKLFLEGKSDTLIEQMGVKMKSAAEAKAYEEAAIYRDLLMHLNSMRKEQHVVAGDEDVDIIAADLASNRVVICIVFVRKGRVLGDKLFYPNIPENMNIETIMEQFLPQYYLNPIHQENLPKKIVLSHAIQNKDWLETGLTDHKKSLSIVVRKSKTFHHWLIMAKRNAEYALSQLLHQNLKMVKQLETLQRALEFSDPIHRMECFDVSHTFGEFPVASCVVFGQEGSIKADYRRYSIRGVTPGDDYGALKQALKRRYAERMKKGAVMPDLLLIDGGKGQLSTAVEAMSELGLENVPVLGVAKGRSRKPGKETLFLSGKGSPFFLKPEDPALHVIQQIRDEAHRFAISLHRLQRGKRIKHSVLETIRGVGPGKAKQLLGHFGDLNRLKNATPEEIAEVKGINAELAHWIYKTFHPFS